MSSSTACAAGDRPALMTKVTNLSLRQSEGSEREIDGDTGREEGGGRRGGRGGAGGIRRHQHK